VAGSVLGDVLDRVLEAVHHADSERQREVLRVPVLCARRRDGGRPREGARALVAAKLDPGLRELRERPRRNFRGRLLVHQQRLRGVAHARPLDLRIEDDRARLAEICARIHVDVAVARCGVDHRHRRMLDQRRLQPLAPRGMIRST